MDDAPQSRRSIRRRDLPAVVQRAAELAAQDDDTNEELSEEEVVRIAAELGLPARHVKAALYEVAREEPAPGFLDRQFGTPRILVSRAVPLEAARARRIVEDHFTSSEYMTVVRRQADSIVFEPAADVGSKIARKFKRGSSHQLANAQVLEVSVRVLEAGWSHVRLRAVFKDERKGRMAGAIVGGTLLGIPVGAVFGALGAAITHNGIVAVAAGSIATVAAAGAIFAGIFASLRKNYREWRERTMMQSEGVLDHLEKGDDLRAQPPAWIRKLQTKLGEFKI